MADVVCCTLSGAGSPQLLEGMARIPGFRFDAVFIDEAAQAVEPSALIPLKFNPQVHIGCFWHVFVHINILFTLLCVAWYYLLLGRGVGGRPEPVGGHHIQQGGQGSGVLPVPLPGNQSTST